jgi:transcriptional regulator with XRE-family HTH domain
MVKSLLARIFLFSKNLSLIIKDEENIMDKKKLTMNDIAKIAGVAKSTVSRYFNGGYVKEETRIKLKKIVDEYNNRRRDEAYANEVLDDVAEQLAQLLSELKTEKDSFKNMGIDYEEKAFYDILKAVANKYEFEYPDDKMIELSRRIKLIVDDKSRYTDWSTRDDIKANLQVDLILLLDEFGYPPVTLDDVYKEVLEQAENFKKYAD